MHTPACGSVCLSSCPSCWLPSHADFDPTNTTLFIGGLSGGVTEDQLRAAFARFGDIIYVKIPAVSNPPGTPDLQLLGTVLFHA